MEERLHAFQRQTAISRAHPVQTDPGLSSGCCRECSVTCYAVCSTMCWPYPLQAADDVPPSSHRLTEKERNMIKGDFNSHSIIIDIFP